MHSRAGERDLVSVQLCELPAPADCGASLILRGFMEITLKKIHVIIYSACCSLNVTFLPSEFPQYILVHS